MKAFTHFTWKQFVEARDMSDDLRLNYRLFIQSNAMFFAARHGWPTRVATVLFWLRSCRIILADRRIYFCVPHLVVGIGHPPMIWRY